MKSEKNGGYDTTIGSTFQVRESATSDSKCSRTSAMELEGE